MTVTILPATITAGDVARAVLAEVLANPSTVYQPHGNGRPCRYLTVDADGRIAGSCLLGRALMSLGIAPAAFVEGAAIPLLLSYLGIRLALADHPDTINWLHVLQRLQDAPMPWGMAADIACRYYPNVVAALRYKPTADCVSA